MRPASPDANVMNICVELITSYREQIFTEISMFKK